MLTQFQDTCRDMSMLLVDVEGFSEEGGITCWTGWSGVHRVLVGLATAVRGFADRLLGQPALQQGRRGPPEITGVGFSGP